MTLGEYIRDLVAALGRSDPAGSARLREVVGARAARIELDDEAVEVVFANGELQLRTRVGFPVDGTGRTDTATVLDLLDGKLEVSTAILDDRLRLAGDCEDIARMCVAIEILLAASARSPELQALATDFRASHRAATRRSEGVAWYPFSPPASELSLLDRLDLLQDGVSN
jgi:SCP-2 sterol transfer family